jgi:hypothetical protein
MIAMPDKLARTPARSQWKPMTPEMKVSFRTLVNDSIRSSGSKGGRITGVAVRDSTTRIQFRGAPYYTRVFITRDSEVTISGSQLQLEKNARAAFEVYPKASRVYEETNFGLPHADVGIPQGDFSLNIKLPETGLYAVHHTWETPGGEVERSKYPISILRIPDESGALRDASRHWARRDLGTLYSLGTIGGYPDGTIRPDKSVTRAEFVKMLCGALKITVDPSLGSTFTDMPGHWANAYVATAERYGWVSKSRFGGSFMTRGDMAFILARVVDPKAQGKSGFPDVPEADQAGVAALVDRGILRGMPDGTFGTGRPTTRAEAATVLSRLRRWRYERSAELWDKEDQAKSGYIRK